MITRKYLLLIGMFFLISLSFLNLISSANYYDNLGCCFDSTIGTCSPNSRQADCSGTWIDDDNCQATSQCTTGCCLLGDGTSFITSRLCQLEANARGFTFDWRQISNAQCSQLSGGMNKGACLYIGTYENQCVFTTKNNCQTNDFYEGFLCTAPELNTTCEKTSDTTLVNGKDGIYFVDDCGNIANIYDATKYNDDNYWTTLISKNNSCGATVDNANSASCGNCDFNRGSVGARMSGATMGNYMCKDLDCGDIDGSFRENGDSWCDPTAFGGAYVDIMGTEIKKPEQSFGQVGSRFMNKFCLNGEVHYDPCDDFKMEFCSESNGSAECVLNPWQECLAAGNDSEMCDSTYCYIPRLHDCVDFSCAPGSSRCGDSGRTEAICGDERSSWGDTATENGWDSGTVTEISSDLLEDLDIVTCLPKVPGGLNFWPNQGSFSVGGDSVCSLGNFEASTMLDHDMGNKWRVKGGSSGDSTVDIPNGEYGNAGLISLNPSNWDLTSKQTSISFCGYDSNPLMENSYIYTDGTSYWCIEDERHTAANLAKVNAMINNEIISDPTVEELLSARCSGIADCVGRGTWKGGSGSGENPSETTAQRASTEKIRISYSFECLTYSAAAGSSSCQECQYNEEVTGIPCTEYRCKALGSNCEHNTAGGKGYCTASNDYSAPVIGHSKNPQEQVAPFNPIEITITTDETSHCRFNIGNSGGTYDDMSYDVDANWSRTHLVRLNLPGQIPITDNFTEYSLITKDGIYNMYVRCSDVAGNKNINAHLVQFDIMQTPDKNPPVIRSFDPISGSPIKYNTTQKNIEIELNEPAECRWDFTDNNFSLLENEFDCDESITDKGSLEGYSCSGILYNVTKHTNETTEYFIRCKDQPWLDISNPNTTFYSRNVHTSGTKYELTASEKFRITNFDPSGQVMVSPHDTSVELVLQTSGGGYQGRSNCTWRFVDGPEGNYSTLFFRFSQTQSNVHKQILSNRSEGNYVIEAVCEDPAENKKNATTSFNIKVDDRAPLISRILKNGNNLKLMTSELAKCYFDYWTCGFQIENGTAMTTGYSEEHSSDWNSGFKVHVKCMDIWNNQEGGCVEIIRPGIF